MREILFRGKRVDNGEWFYGFYGKSGEKAYIIYDNDIAVAYISMKEVIPETVGQYTGLTDKNGTKIFEGDIIKAQDDIFGSPFCDGITGKVVYEESAYFIEPQNPYESEYLFNECAVYEVIGNIHDNPELLKGGAE